MTRKLQQPVALPEVLDLLNHHRFEAVGVVLEGPTGDLCYKLNIYQAHATPDATRKAVATLLLAAGFTAFGISTVVLYNTSLMPDPQEYVELELWPLHQDVVPLAVVPEQTWQPSRFAPSNN